MNVFRATLRLAALARDPSKVLLEPRFSGVTIVTLPLTTNAGRGGPFLRLLPHLQVF